MNVTRIMRHLRSEQHGIEHAILLIERSNRTADATAMRKSHTSGEC